VTLRVRLLLALGLLLSAALVVSGALVVGLTRASLVGQLDDDIRTVNEADLFGGTPQGSDDPTGRRFALLIYDRSGRLVQSIRSGHPSNPDPLPDVSLSPEPSIPFRQIVERSSVDGSLSYRLVGLPGPQGAAVVLAAPMTGIERSMAVLIRTLVLVGLIVLGLMLLVGWLIIRRGLTPLEQVTATAERISAGDLSQRVDVVSDGSEVGRLGHAFNRMLDQIQGAFQSQQQALADKERSEAQLRQFVADASHELRTPLTALRGYSELYRAGGLGQEAELEQAMARIGSESRRMAALVEDLLLLARLDQGRPLRNEPVSLSDVVSDALNDFRAVEPARSVTAHVEPGVTVAGDEDRLRQVVGNLLTNVRVHTPLEASVEVALSDSPDTATLTVADRGPGIDAAHIGRVFDRFYRADPARSRDRGGSGLGLSIAASVAAAHDGRISYSETPGGGATFTLTLPHRGWSGPKGQGAA
jgi:two-component system OmpR family sensor kinase